MFPKTTLVIGGAASGKSAWAEKLVISATRPKTYLATSQAHDTEMLVKINQHQARRDASWTLIEAPLNPPLSTLRPGHICLLDCATMWLTNHLLAESNLPVTQSALLNAITTCPADLVIVTNEVGHGIVPGNALSRQFREAQGRLNIALAAQADLVVQIIAGLPLTLKGHLP
ncbi:MAG: bifunctional adenosylcobinamide kinase/adenosylcobinamide-phosphate guanylyltransferase [Rhodobacteraceae bacterium]|nr:bifunctional adenosylcobinamide kinase/adenosylcobinamide-phosphate guanylyltransferase [Paracoccaceae bacterium]